MISFETVTELGCALYPSMVLFVPDVSVFPASRPTAVFKPPVAANNALEPTATQDAAVVTLISALSPTATFEVPVDMLHPA